MNRRFSYATARLVLAEGIVRGVKQPKALTDPRLQILTITLKRHIAPDIHAPQIHGRLSVADPLGSHFTHTPGRLQANRIESSRNKAILQLRRLAEVVAHVRSKTLGATKKLLHTRPLQCG